MCHDWLNVSGHSLLIISHLLFKQGRIGTWIQVCATDIGTKDLSNRPIYAVLNTHNLDMILQLKYMPIVMNPARIASSDWNPRNAMICDTPYLQNEFGDPRSFFTFLIQFYHFLPAVKVFKKSVRGNFWARTSLRYLQVNTLRELIIGIYLHEFTNNEREISTPRDAAVCSIENFELVNECR